MKLLLRQRFNNKIGYTLYAVRPTGVSERGKEVQPPLSLQNLFLICVFAKHTVQALLLYSLNPNFSSGIRQKLYDNFIISYFASISGGLSPTVPYRSFAPGPHWGLLSPDPVARPPPFEPPPL